MTVYKFTVTYAGLSQYNTDQIVVESAKDSVENLEAAFKKALEHASKRYLGQLRGIRLDDCYRV